jgi:hypothetical protein
VWTKLLPKYLTAGISRVYAREIGNMDEGIVEGCEDTGDTEDEFTCAGSVCAISGGEERNYHL